MTKPPDLTPPPPEVQTRLRQLSDLLDHSIPAKQLDHNLLIATWNLRAFGGLTEKWVSGAADSPKRNLADICYIAAVASRFDAMAVQEVRGDLRALRYLLKALGPDWGVIMTDVTESAGGNDERLAFLFDTRRVKPSGLAGEFAEPFDPATGAISKQALGRQFARVRRMRSASSLLGRLSSSSPCTRSTARARPIGSRSYGRSPAGLLTSPGRSRTGATT